VAWSHREFPKGETQADLNVRPEDSKSEASDKSLVIGLSTDSAMVPIYEVS